MSSLARSLLWRGCLTCPGGAGRLITGDQVGGSPAQREGVRRLTEGGQETEAQAWSDTQRYLGYFEVVPPGVELADIAFGSRAKRASASVTIRL